LLVACHYLEGQPEVKNVRYELNIQGFWVTSLIPWGQGSPEKPLLFRLRMALTGLDLLWRWDYAGIKYPLKRKRVSLELANPL